MDTWRVHLRPVGASEDSPVGDSVFVKATDREAAIAEVNEMDLKGWEVVGATVEVAGEPVASSPVDEIVGETMAPVDPSVKDGSSVGEFGTETEVS